MERVLPPLRPMTAQNSSTGSSGSRSRPVRLLKMVRSVFGQFFADDRDQERSPRSPTIAAKQPAEIAIARKRLAHRDELAQFHGAALRRTGLEKCSTSGFGFAVDAAFSPSSRSIRRREFDSPP